MKRILLITTAILLCVSFASCNKEEEKGTTIYGAAFDAITGNPISNVSVGIRGYVAGDPYKVRNFVNTVTGSDGSYEMSFPPIEYWDIDYHEIVLYAEKNGYYDYSLEIVPGNSCRMDILMEPHK